jgi:hypothetical protein
MAWWIGASKEIADAIEQLERSSDRAVAIIAAVILEQYITAAIRRRWCNNSKVAEAMLRVDGALGNLGPKIDLAHLMGLISVDGHKDMTLIKKIRNRFAHYLDVDTCDAPLIKGWCCDLTHFEHFVLKFVHAPSLADFITIIVGFKFSVHTAAPMYSC